MPRAFQRMAVTQHVGMIFYWNFDLWKNKTEFKMPKMSGYVEAFKGKYRGKHKKNKLIYLRIDDEKLLKT